MTNMPSMDASSEPTSDDKLWVLLTWIFTPLVPIIILLMADKKDRPFIKAHNMQALIWGVVNFVLTAVLSFVVIGACVGPVMWLIGVYFGYQGYQGKLVNIPVLTDFVKGQGWA
jgi:uncharacterized membrane protein